jgi:hypothetical protein
MASMTKASVAIATALSIAASTATAATNTVPMASGFDLGITGTITNSATGPTAGQIIQLQASVDSGVTWYTVRQVVGLLGANVVTPFTFDALPNGWPLLRLYATGSANQITTLSAVAGYVASIA